jgi:hypothetical protein
MRMMLKLQIPVETGNEAVKSGAVGTAVRAFAERAKPECMYFTLGDGWRTAYFVFDMQSSSEMPRLLEPLFMEMDASIELTPCMNAEELITGLKAAELA